MIYMLEKLKWYKCMRSLIGENKDFHIVYDTFLWSIIRFFRSKLRFLYRLYKWIPIIYKDEDWDYDYLLEIIDHKLSMMQKELDNDIVHSDIKLTKTKMRLIRGSLDRYRYPEKYIGEAPPSQLGGDKEFWGVDEETGCCRLKPSDNPEWIKYIEYENKYQEKNFKRFFNYMHKYLRYLWT